MAHAIKKVVFIGASGSIGGPVFKHFVKSGLDITVLTRAGSTTKYAEGLKVIRHDYKDPGLVDALKGQEAIVSFVSSSALLDQIPIIDAAAKAGVTRFILSEFGSNTLNPKAQELVFLYKQKISIIDHLKTVVEEYPSFSWTGIATGPIFDWAIAVGFLGYDLKTNTALIYDDGNVKFSATNIGATAQACLGTLEKLEATKNKYLFVASVTVTQTEVLHSLEKATGKTWTVNKASVVESEKEGKEKMAKGDFSGILKLLPVMMFGGECGANFEEHGLSNELLGLPHETLDETIKLVVEGKLP